MQSEIQDVSRALRESTKNLCRNKKDNPNISGNLMKIQRERTDIIEILNMTVRELQEAGTCETLVSKVYESKAQQDRENEIIEREKNMAAAVKQLDRDLTTEKADHQEAIAAQRSQIAVLKEQLQKIKGTTAVDAKYTRKAETGRTNAIVRSYTQAERAQQTRIKELERKLEMENVVHGETVDFLQKKMSSLQNDLESWGRKHEADFGALQGEYEALRRRVGQPRAAGPPAGRKAEMDEKDAERAEETRICSRRKRRRRQAQKRGRVRFAVGAPSAKGEGQGGKKGKKGKKGRRRNEPTTGTRGPRPVARLVEGMQRSRSRGGGARETRRERTRGAPHFSACCAWRRALVVVRLLDTIKLVFCTRFLSGGCVFSVFDSRTHALSLKSSLVHRVPSFHRPARLKKRHHISALIHP